MPSSLIFTGLVVIWLLILVPAVARHQQEVAHLSDASLAGRVLARPRRRGERRLEGHPIEEDSVDDDGTVGTRPKEVWVPTARKAAQRVDVAVPAQSRWDAAEESEAELDGEWRDHLCFAITAEEPATGGLVGRVVATGRAERV